ncbi:MAG TPA: S24 family peptidase [Chthoniobacter sp.]|nr:S24 family peptidase [Chthoniobacter sp.]
MTLEEKEEQKAFVKAVLDRTGLTPTQVANKIGLKEMSVKKMQWGDIRLTERNRAQLQQLAQSYREGLPVLDLVLREDSAELWSGNSRNDGRSKLRWALKEVGSTPGAAAKEIGYDSAIIENVVNGSGRMSESMATALIDFLQTKGYEDISIEDLLGGSDMPRVIGADGILGTVGERPTPSNIPGEVERTVPLLSWAAAGKISNLDFLDDAYDATGVKTTVKDPRAFAVQVDGDSMSPEFKQGDYIVVAPHSRPELGKPVIVRTIHGDVLCKHYQTKDGGKIVILSSVNKTYEPIEIPRSEIMWIYPVKEARRKY